VPADLSKTPFARVLWSASASGVSGDLIVRNSVTKIVYFDQGRLVSASSAVEQDRLGELLVGLGRITEDERRQAEQLMTEGKEGRFGDALVATGALTRDEIGRVLARQVKQIVHSLFGVTSGFAHMVEQENPSVPVENMVGVSLHRLLYVGIRSMRVPELVQAGLGDLDRVVTLAPVPPFRFILRKCPPGELRILEEVRTPTTIRDLVSSRGELSAPRAKAVYALLAAGVIEELPGNGQEPASRPVAHIESNTFLLSAAEAADSVHDRAVRKEVDQELSFLERLDLDAWTRVATREDVVSALADKLRRYIGFLERTEDDSRLRREVETLVGRITIFLIRMGGDPVQGARQRAEMRRDLDATQTIPPGVLSSVGALRAQAANGAPVIGRRPTVDDLGAVESLERLLRTGDLRTRMKDHAGAAQAYRRLVERAPDVPEYRLTLALALARFPPTVREAEREFLEAARRDPNNPQVHLQFGRYYKQLRLKTRAVAELRAAVSLAPQLEEAREELRKLSPDDAALTRLNDSSVERRRAPFPAVRRPAP